MNRADYQVLSRRLDWLKSQVKHESPKAMAYSWAEISALEHVLAARLALLHAHCGHCGYRRFHVAAPIGRIG